VAGIIKEMTKKLPAAKGFIKISKKYGEMYPLRAFIQGIPHLGGPFDTILAGAGANWQIRRLEAFIYELNHRLERISNLIPELTPDEPLYDFVRQVFDEVITHRSEKKRQLFVNIVTKQIVERHDWEEAETAARLLAALTELDIEILATAASAPTCSGDLEGLRIVTFIDQKEEDKPGRPPLDLRIVFPNLPILVLRMSCAKLSSRGLLHDEGIGRWAIRAFELFRPTELGDWFISWIKEQAGPPEHK
jgi:hypothetical protein